MSNNIESLKSDNQANTNSTMAIAFIVIGIILFLINYMGVQFENWWMLFSLIPLPIFLYNAWKTYQETGMFSGAVKGNLIASGAVLFGIIMFLTSFTFLFPASIIFAGFVMLISSR